MRLSRFIIIFIFAAYIPATFPITANAAEIHVPTRVSTGLYPFKRYEPVKPHLVIALSGGGLRGFSHIGVLEALDKEGIEIDGIAGVSIGALIGGLYAGGLSPAEMIQRFKALDIKGLILDQPERRTLLFARKQEHSRHLLELRFDQSFIPILPGAIAPGQRVYTILLDFTLSLPYRNAESWTNLRTPVRILATDLKTGKGVEFDSGDLAPAIRASMSVPLLFDPLTIDDTKLVDGGITTNIPVSIARRMNGDIVLAVDATSPLELLGTPVAAWQIANQVTTIMQKDDNAVSLHEADVAIRPDLEGISNIDLIDFNEIVEIGRKATQHVIPELRKLLQPPSEQDDALTLLVRDIEYYPIDFSFPEQYMLDMNDDHTTLGDIRVLLRKFYSIGIVNRAWADYDSTSASLVIHIVVNPPLEAVDIHGNKRINSDVLLASFHEQLNMPVDYDLCQNSLEHILREYRNRGYPAAEITAVNWDNTDKRLEIYIDEGILSRITFEGLRGFSSLWLNREFPLKVGQPITREGVLKGMNNLYATGLFRTVYPIIKRSPYPDSGWDIVVNVVEHPSPPLRLGLSYQRERGTRSFAEFTLTNPLNYAARLILFSSFGQRDVVHRISVLADKVYGLPVIYNLNIGYAEQSRNRYDTKHHVISDYTETRWGIGFHVGGEASGWGLLTLTGRAEQHENIYAGNRDDYLLTALGARIGLDTQDRFPYPRRGVRGEIAAEAAGEFTGSNRSFNHIWGELDSYYTFKRRNTIGLGILARTGDRTTPQDEYFRLGGMYSFPGLHLDEISGLVQAAGRIEFRYDLLSRLLSDVYIGARMDVGGSWDDPSAQIRWADLMTSGSAYIVLDTFLGPIHLQWSYLFPSSNIEPHSIFYIQLGNLF